MNTETTIKSEKSKRFTAVVGFSDSTIETCIDNLPGWSHCSEPFQIDTYSYPFKEWVRRIYFTAKHRREACKLIERACVHVYRPLSEGD